MKIGLVGCVKTKQPAAAPAGKLYASDLFRKRRRAVEHSCDRWFILSAKHGLLDPHELIDPYDETLGTASRAERRAWSQRVLEQLGQAVDDPANHDYEIHAGSDYWAWGLRASLEEAGATVHVPTEGLTIGQSLAWYGGGASDPDAGIRPRQPKIGGKYQPLREWLAERSEDVELSFAEIETILGDSLPASARRHSAWWSNDRTHSQALAWLEAGYAVEAVRMTAEHVRFGRSR